MSKVLTVRRSDLSPLIVHPETQESVFPAEYSEERQPFHIIAQTPGFFYNLETEMVERDIAEKDVTRLQVIPYIALMDQTNGNVFAYTRGQKGGEDRLKEKTSIGLGGHIDLSPNLWLGFPQILAMELARELEEEVGLKFIGNDLENLMQGLLQGSMLIFSESDEVGRVHIGLSMVIGVMPDFLPKLEDGVIENGRWVSIQQLVEESNAGQIEIEMWTRLLLMQLQANAAAFAEQNQQPQAIEAANDATQILEPTAEPIAIASETSIEEDLSLPALEGQSEKEIPETVVEVKVDLNTMAVNTTDNVVQLPTN